MRIVETAVLIFTIACGFSRPCVDSEQAVLIFSKLCGLIEGESRFFCLTQFDYAEMLLTFNEVRTSACFGHDACALMHDNVVR